MTKPFSPRELVARVRAMLRRPWAGVACRPDGARAPSVPLTIDRHRRDVWLDGEPVALTRTEFDLLAALSERPRMAFSRRQLIDAVWGATWVGDEHLVDVHIGTCAASSATTPPRRGSSAPCAGSATGWAPAVTRPARRRTEAGPARPGRPAPGAQALVLLAGAATSWLVASVVGPRASSTTTCSGPGRTPPRRPRTSSRPSLGPDHRPRRRPGPSVLRPWR